jgi:uncharacterized lipoprotein YmbA
MKYWLHAISRAATVLTLMASISGCVAGKSAPARFYILSALADAPMPRENGNAWDSLNIGIGPVSIAAYLDRNQIVTRKGPSVLELAEFDRWAEPLDQSIKGVLLENLSTLLGSKRITLVPEEDHTHLDCQVVVRITGLDGVLGQRATLNARWILLDSDRHKIIEWESTTVNEPTNAPGYQALVEAQSRDLLKLSRQIAGAMETWRRSRAK